MDEEIESYIAMMKEIQENILLYIEDEESSDSNYKNLSQLFTILFYQYGDLQLKSILQIIAKISNNHRRSPTFFIKIERIIRHFQKKIKQTYSNQEIFDFFKSNKRIILFLIKEGVLTIDESIKETISEPLYEKAKYSDYFSPEIGLTEKVTKKYETIDDFETKRKEGENPSLICQMIRDDLIDEFIVYVTKTNFYLGNKIKPSIFETNSFLLDKSPTLIEYSAFYGSIQIFKYLLLNGVEVDPDIWLYAIHGKNADLIHYLEEKRIFPSDKTYEQCFKESIKCHHNEFASYFECNYVDTDYQNNYTKKKFNDNIISYAFRYYNYFFFPNELNTNFVLYYWFQYEYIYIVKFLVENKKFDFLTNQKKI